jgi:4-hydroxy-2-oxoheptanedioate aldolase
MLARVIAAGKKTGTPTGMHVMTSEAALARAAQGMQFIAVASELRMMTEKAQQMVAALGLGAGKDVARY